jgi:hypothetical protein
VFTLASRRIVKVFLTSLALIVGLALGIPPATAQVVPLAVELITPTNGATVELSLRSPNFVVRGRPIDIAVRIPPTPRKIEQLEVRAAMVTPLFGIPESEVWRVERLNGLLQQTPEDPTLWKQTVLMPDAPGLYYWQLQGRTLNTTIYRSEVFTLTVVDLPVPSTTQPIVTTSPSAVTTLPPSDGTTPGSSRPTTTKVPVSVDNPRYARFVDSAMTGIVRQRYQIVGSMVRAFCLVKPGTTADTRSIVCQAPGGSWIFRDAEYSYRLKARGIGSNKGVTASFVGTRSKLNCKSACSSKVSFSDAASF